MYCSIFYSKQVFYVINKRSNIVSIKKTVALLLSIQASKAFILAAKFVNSFVFVSKKFD